jgi:hypothetical protein
LQFLVPLAILGLAVAVRFLTKNTDVSNWRSVGFVFNVSNWWSVGFVFSFSSPVNVPWHIELRCGTY